MKNKELHTKIIEVLQDKSRLTPQEIAYKIEGSPALIQVHGVLSALKGQGKVQEINSDRIRYYTLVETNHISGSVTSRNLSKFSFDGKMNLSKGRLALAVVHKFVSDTNPSLNEVKAMFPDEIVKPYGVVQSEVLAHELSPDPKRKRYFLDEDDIIKLNKGKVNKVCVTNQWTSDRFLKLLDVAEGRLGYEIVKSE